MLAMKVIVSVDSFEHLNALNGSMVTQNEEHEENDSVWERTAGTTPKAVAPPNRKGGYSDIESQAPRKVNISSRGPVGG